MNAPEEGFELQSMSVETGTVALITKAEIDQQIATAQRFPRSIKRFVAACRCREHQGLYAFP